MRLVICSALFNSALSRVMKVMMSEAAVFASCRISDFLARPAAWKEFSQGPVEPGDTVWRRSYLAIPLRLASR